MKASVGLLTCALLLSGCQGAENPSGDPPKAEADAGAMGRHGAALTRLQGEML